MSQASLSSAYSFCLDEPATRYSRDGMARAPSVMLIFNALADKARKSADFSNCTRGQCAMDSLKRFRLCQLGATRSRVCTNRKRRSDSEAIRDRLPPPGIGVLSDYVPFYFTPLSPMMLNIKTGYNGITQRANDEIAVLVSSFEKLQERDVRFVFSDRHALLQAANFFDGVESLDRIDWRILQNRDFRRDPDDPEKMGRYMAECSPTNMSR